MKVISGSELARILKSRGWGVDRIKGSHHAMSDGTRKVIVPVHRNKDLKIGLQAQLMKDAGITEADL